jgi:hypothetical protein
MKFVVDRTSGWIDGQPCPEATKERIWATDVRTVPTLDQARKAHWAGSFFQEGRTGFREEGGYVMADFETDAWTVEIDCLTCLMAFVEKYGRVIVFPVEPDFHSRDYPRLEIYDDYRE